MSKILVTGGCGYIGSHTIVDLLQNDFDAISVDNNSRSTPALLEGIEKITGRKIKNYKVDLCNYTNGKYLIKVGGQTYQLMLIQ